MIASIYSSVERVLSVSSILRIKVPLLCLAKSQLKRAVLAPPKCRCPVGLGANLTLIFSIKNSLLHFYSSQYNRFKLYSYTGKAGEEFLYTTFLKEKPINPNNAIQ